MRASAGPETVALQTGFTVSESRNILRQHKRVYPRFWEWSEAALNLAMLTGRWSDWRRFKLKPGKPWRTPAGRSWAVLSFVRTPKSWHGQTDFRTSGDGECGKL